MKSKKNIDWHSGFAGGLGLCFRKYREHITIEREHLLSKQPMRIDFLVVKKQADVVIDNSLGRCFRTHNIVEYKNPYDALNVDVIWKTIGYAALYKSQGERVNQISINEITVSVYRYRISKRLFKNLMAEGYTINEIDNGIYKLEGPFSIPVYLVAISELSEHDLLSLKVMVKNADERNVRAFIDESRKYNVPGDKTDADAVLQVSYEANVDMYRRMRGEADMCEALRELFADDIEKEKRESVEKRDTEKITEMLERGKTPEEIADFCGYPIAQVQEVYNSLSNKK